MRIDIVGEHPVVRAGLRVMCEAAGVSVASESGVWQALELAPINDLDAVLLEPFGHRGLLETDTCSRLVAHFGSVPILVVVSQGTVNLGVLRLLASGIAGVVDISADTANLLPALEAIGRGLEVVQPPHEVLALRGSGGGRRTVEDIDVEILHWLARGYRDRDVGAKVGLGESAVKHRIERLIKRYSLGTRFAAGVWAVGQGLVEASVDPAEGPGPGE